MGTGWRRAFCTTVTRDSESNVAEKQQQRSPSPSPSPRSCVGLSFFSGSSNPTTPRLRCRTSGEAAQMGCAVSESPRVQCKTTPRVPKSQKPSLGSNPSSPRSPLKLSLFRNSFKFRNSCGICLNSVKTGQGTAIYTAECSHAFHFPCIVANVRKHRNLVCPVCNATWNDVPLLTVHKNTSPESDGTKYGDAENDVKPEIEDKRILESSPRAITAKLKSSEEKLSKPLDSRAYDDDEPLFSPASAGRINPIPETDENGEGEDELEEFQGFFVCPNSQSSVASQTQPELKARERSSNVQVRLLPEIALISAGRSHETYAVAMRVKAPPPLPAHSNRAPIDLVSVLDVSGSMTGSKLSMLKRAMRLVISSLGSSDRLSIVGFSDSPKRLLPLRRMTAQGQRAARRVVDRLVCGQGTSVGEALRKATKVLEDRRERNPVASIMLLSDGQNERVHNNGLYQRQWTKQESSTRFSHIEIPVHSFGFGHDPAEDAFSKCVGGLLSVVVRDLRIQLGSPSGSSPVDIEAIYTVGARPAVCSSGSLRLGDLYAEEERELLVELRVPISAVGNLQAVTVQCLYKDPATQEVVYGREQALLVPRPDAVHSRSPKIERLRNQFIATRAIAESRRLIEHGDCTNAYHLLASARALLLQSNSVSGDDDYVRQLQAELSELQWRRLQRVQQQQMFVMHRRRGGERELPAMVDENGEPLTPTSAWRAAERLAKVAIMKKSVASGIGDLHGFENARF